jgi:Transposase DNA-binding
MSPPERAQLLQVTQSSEIFSSPDRAAGFLTEDGRQFQDARLGRRFQKLVQQFENRLGDSIPLACQDWTNTKAAYRFLATGESVREPSWQGTFKPLAIERQPSLVRFWFCMTPLSSSTMADRSRASGSSTQGSKAGVNPTPYAAC